MSLQDFENKIQTEIHPDLSCRVNWLGAPDVAGIYYQDVYLGVVVPADGPAKIRSELFVDANGASFRSEGEAIRDIKVILSNAKKMSKLAKDKKIGDE